MRRTLIPALCLLPLCHLWAAVTGTVRDDSNEPVAGARIQIVNASDSTRDTTVVADNQGRYSLNLPLSATSVRAPHAGRSQNGITVLGTWPGPVGRFAVFSLVMDAPGLVELRIYDANGRCVRRISQVLPRGSSTLQWDRTADDGRDVPGGAYLYRLQAGAVSSSGIILVAGAASTAGAGTVVRTEADAGHHLAKSLAPHAESFHIAVYGTGVYPLSQRTVEVQDGETRDFTLEHVDLWDNYRSVLRNDLTNSRCQFEKNRSGRVAFVGGSITSATGWKNNIMDSLSRWFPQTDFDFIDAGLPSVGSSLHAFRLQRDIFSRGRVDLIILESAVNDWDDNSAVLRLRATEGILRQAQAINPDVDVVMAYFTREPYFPPTVGAADPIPNLVQYEQCGWHYGVSSVNLCKHIVENLNLSWSQWNSGYTSDGIHPNPAGHRVYSDGIARLLRTAWKGTLPESAEPVAHHNPSQVIDTFSFYYGHYVDIQEAEASSGWVYKPNWVPSQGIPWIGFTNIPVLESTRAGDTLRLSFTGSTVIGTIFVTTPEGGSVAAYLDGRLVDTYDLVCVYANFDIALNALHDIDLSKDRHELELITRSSGKKVHVFKFEVNKE